jgi:hypothetical protein
MAACPLAKAYHAHGRSPSRRRRKSEKLGTTEERDGGEEELEFVDFCSPDGKK